MRHDLRIVGDHNAYCNDDHTADCWTRPASLVSAQEIADRLGVRKPTVHMWRARGVLPEPDFDLGVGPVWLWETIREWAESTGRLRPGQDR